MKIILLLITIVMLVGCGPNEADFKSTVPIVDPIGDPIEDLMDDPIENNSDKQTIGSPMEPQSEATKWPLRGEDPQLAINWNVPFFPQAPDADWGMPWQEACEEAASILAYYYSSRRALTKEKFKEEIQGLVDWQNENYGDYKHTNIAQTAEMIKGYFRFSDFQVFENPSIDDLKENIAKGYVIIAPFAGRQLGNPFYSGEGPLYHMMVIKGYDEKHFITNDVGTKRGHNFIYPYNTIMSAMHEWDDTDISLGAKKVIVMR